MATGTLAPVGRQQFFDNDGAPLAGGFVYYYQAGTAVLATIYQDSDLTTPHTNPVELDSAGRAAIFLGPGAYDEAVHDAADAQLYVTEGVVALAAYTLNDTIDGVAGENLAFGVPVFVSDGSGGRTAGRWYQTDADTAAMSSTATLVGIVMSTTITIGASGSIRIGGRATGLSGLTAGAKYYCSTTAGALTSSAPTNARLVGVADSTTSLVLTPQIGIVPAAQVAAGTLGSGDFTFFGGFRSATAHANAAAAAAFPGVISFETPVTRFYTGDGTGYSIEICKRSGSTTTRLFRVNETGSVAIECVGVTSFSDGSVSAPVITFASDTNTGFYRKGSDLIGVAAGGVDTFDFGAAYSSILKALFGTAVISPTALTANTTTSNWAPTGFSTALIVRADISDVFDPATLDGIAGGTAGRIVLFLNIATNNPILLRNEGSLSTAANRFACAEGGADTGSVSVPPKTGVVLWYDGTSSRWRVFGGATVGA